MSDEERGKFERYCYFVELSIGDIACDCNNLNVRIETEMNGGDSDDFERALTCKDCMLCDYNVDKEGYCRYKNKNIEPCDIFFCPMFEMI
jgi:hypothetical protein